MKDEFQTTATEGVSIVICCYNSADRLPETLQHIAALDAPKVGTLEIIIVDNCSTDETAKVAIELWRATNSPHELRVVPEKSPGLSNARIRGIKAARHDTIVFCDDDNWLCPTYACTAQEILNKDPRIAIVGCMTQGVIAPGKEPPWFHQIAGGYAVGGTEGCCEIKIGESVWGAGMVARKRALIELYQSGFKFVCADRRGSALSCGGDSELCHALQWIGYTIHYDGRLKLKHFIPNNRLTWNYAVGMAKGWGAATIQGDAIRLVQHKNQKLRNVIRKSFIYHLIRGGVRLVAQLRVLATLNSSEGNVAALSAASTLGRWQAIAGLNIAYAKVIEEKASWLERTKSQSKIIAN